MKPSNHNQTPNLSPKHQRLFDDMAMIINEEFVVNGQYITSDLLYQLFVALRDMLTEE